MNLIKRAFAGAALAAAFIAPSQAALINVGGVTWDPDYNDGDVDVDFIAQFDFTQWFSTSAGTKGSLNFGSATGINTVLASLDNTDTPSDYYLHGGGRFNRINDFSAAFNTGLGGAGTFCVGCEVTYAFGGIRLNKNSTFDLSNAWAQVFVDYDAPALNLPISSQARANEATDGDLWLDLKFNSLGLRMGSTVQAGFVDANLEIIGGLAQNNFVPGTLMYSAQSQFSTNTNASRSTGGNGTALGNSVPEPGSLASMGLGLLGAALVRRRRKK